MLRNRQAIPRLWRLNNRFVILQAVFSCGTALVWCAENSRRGFSMYKNDEEYRLEDFEKLSQELLDMLFPVCEAQRRGYKDEYAKAFSPAAMAVQESIRTFLALLKRQ